MSPIPGNSGGRCVELKAKLRMRISVSRRVQIAFAEAIVAIVFWAQDSVAVTHSEQRATVFGGLNTSGRRVSLAYIAYDGDLD